MSSHQTNKDKPRSAKCRHFCFSFDTHNYCPTCRESGKDDDLCVTFESPCGLCAAFTEEQLIKITHRKCYVKKQKRDTNKDDELDLLGDEHFESFTGSHADFESAADNLFTSSPRPQPLPFESLSIKTPAKSVPPIPGTAFQQKIESKRNRKGGKCKISRVLLFLVPKPHQRWRPVIDLSRLNTFLHVEKFKMETPESMRTSLILGEWVLSIDLFDDNLHIPIHPNSRKYLSFATGHRFSSSSQSLRRLNPKLRKVPILRKQPNVDMSTPVNI